MLLKIKIFVTSRKPCWHVRGPCLTHNRAPGTWKKVTVSSFGFPGPGLKASEPATLPWALEKTSAALTVQDNLLLCPPPPVPCPQDSLIPVITAVVSVPSSLVTQDQATWVTESSSLALNKLPNSLLASFPVCNDISEASQQKWMQSAWWRVVGRGVK